MMAQFTSGVTLLALGNDMSDTLMGKIDIIHYVGGYAFAAGLVLRILWLFVGPPTARWRDLLPLTPAQRRVWRETLFCYLGRGTQCPDGLEQRAGRAGRCYFK